MRTTAFVLVVAMASALGLTTALADGPSEGTGGAVLPVDGVCPTGKTGTPTVLSALGTCVDPTPPSALELEVARTKKRAVMLWQAKRSGDGRAAVAFEKALVELRNLTGETRTYPSLSTSSPDELTTMDAVLYLTVYRQINWYYCGPATAQTILTWLGPQQSQTLDTVYGGYPTLTGNSANDQTILANEFWLATDKYWGTNWNSVYMPFTLNAWRGSSWYLQAQYPTKADAWWYIDFDMNYGYPIAENVRYLQGQSYIPAGFNPSGDYTHWDVIKGNWVDPCPSCPPSKNVYIGQVYASPGYTWYPNQWQVWDTHWKAIDIWYGIVW